MVWFFFWSMEIRTVLDSGKVFLCTVPVTVCTPADYVHPPDLHLLEIRWSESRQIDGRTCTAPKLVSLPSFPPSPHSLAAACSLLAPPAVNVSSSAFPLSPEPDPRGAALAPLHPRSPSFPFRFYLGLYKTLSHLVEGKASIRPAGRVGEDEPSPSRGAAATQCPSSPSISLCDPASHYARH